MSPDIVEPGVLRAKLDPADPDFAPCTDHPLLAQAATAVLGQDWHLAALNLRAPLPGCGHQGLHPDSDQRRTNGPWQTLSAIWCITAFTKDNGPLRVIPGSHRVSKPPMDMLAFGSGMGPHPDEVRIVAPAGSVIMFNSANLWHSGTFNYSPAPRLRSPRASTLAALDTYITAHGQQVLLFRRSMEPVRPVLRYRKSQVSVLRGVQNGRHVPYRP